MNIDELRSLFPQTAGKVYGKPLVYLDNAATSLRPLPVVRKWEEMSLKYNSNLHRAVHCTAVAATEEYESTREAVASFIGAEFPEEIVFTSGTTQSVNLLAATLGKSFSEGDEIIISAAEHHSNIVPWQLLKDSNKLIIKVLPINEQGELRLDLLPSLLSDRTKICCVSQVSNVLGVVNPVRKIADTCHANGTLLLVDGAQGIPHVETDVRRMDCDFYAFSGHKMYAAPGTGVLYGKKHLLENLPPYMGGGEMIESVSWDKTTFAPIPRRFEAGTQNISGVPTLKPAIELIKQMRDSDLVARTSELKDWMLETMASEPGVTLYGNPHDAENKISLFSIAVDGVHHEDLALILDKMGIATRSGQMCAEPLMDSLGVTGLLRASFAPYNTMDEARYFVESLRKAVKMLR